jgi:hypothetical protein
MSQTATPSTPAAQAPAQPAQSPNAQSPNAPPDHGTIFRNVLGILAGGNQRPQLDSQGNPVTDQNGQVRMETVGAKKLGYGILSGAIASMVAGMAAPTAYKQFGEGMAARQVPDYGASVAAGANAAQPFMQEGAKNKAQLAADENRGRAIAIMDHNLKFRTMALAADQADRKGQQDVVDAYSDQVNAMNVAYEKGATDTQGKPIDLWKMQNIPGTAVQKLMVDKTLGITKDMVIPVGVVEVPNEDGQGSHSETMFSVYNPQAVIHMSDDLRANPAYKQLSSVANGTALPVSVIANMSMNKGNMTLASSGVNNWVKGFNNSIPKGSDINPIKDFNLPDAADSDKTGQIKKLLPYINKYRQDDLISFFNDMKKDPNIAKDQSLQAGSALLQEAMGVTSEDLGKMAEAKLDDKKTKEAVDKAQAEAAAKRSTPEGQADLQHKRLENQQLEQNLAQAAAQGKGIQVPKGFVSDPRVAEMPVDAVQKDLASKGVEIPANFQALYAIGHNAADLATLPTTPRKGVAVMPRDQALSFIRTYINPQYNEVDYSAAKKLSAELASTRIGVAGGSLMSAGVASQHLMMLEDASVHLQNKDLKGLNAIANSVGAATGSDAQVVFQAIAEQVNSEVAKVVAGGVPGEQELAANRKTLNSDQSPAQVKGVVNKYIGLMNGRIGEIDDRSMQYFGRHVKGISPETAKVFIGHGYSIPGQPQNAKGIGNVQGTPYWLDADGKLLKDSSGQIMKVGQ